MSKKGKYIRQWETKPKQACIRLTAEQHQYLILLAEKKDTTVSDALRMVINEAIERQNET